MSDHWARFERAYPNHMFALSVLLVGGIGIAIFARGRDRWDLLVFAGLGIVLYTSMKVVCVIRSWWRRVHHVD